MTEHRRPLAAWSAIAAAALLPRCLCLNDSLWLDELHTAWVAAGSWSTVCERAQIGNQSPLYFVLPWLMVQGCGLTEWSLRLPSLAAGVALVLAGAQLARRWTNSLTASCLAGLVLALDHLAIFYGTEARPYALVQLLGLWHFAWTLERLRGGNSTPAVIEHRGEPTECWGRRARWIGAGVVLFYLHPTTLLALPVTWLVSGLWPWRSDRRAWRDLAIDTAAVVLLTTPYWRHLAPVVERRGEWNMFIGFQPPTVFARWFPLLAGGVLPWSWLVLARCRCATPDNSGDGMTARAGVAAEPLLIVIAVWFTAAALGVWLATAMKIAPVLLPRYMLFASAAPALFAAVCVGRLPRGRWQRAAAASIIGLLLWENGVGANLWRHGQPIVDRNQDWRGAVAYLNERLAAATAPVLVRGGFVEADQLDQPQPTPAIHGASESKPGEFNPALVAAYNSCMVTGIYAAASREVVPLTNRSPEQRLAWEHVRRIQAEGEAWIVVNGSANTRQELPLRLVRRLSDDGRRWQVGEAKSFGAIGVVHIAVADTGRR